MVFGRGGTRVCRVHAGRQGRSYLCSGEASDLWIRQRRVLDLFSNFTSFEPLEQVITPREPFMVSRKMAMKNEPNIR